MYSDCSCELTHAVQTFISYILQGILVKILTKIQSVETIYFCLFSLGGAVATIVKSPILHQKLYRVMNVLTLANTVLSESVWLYYSV